MTNTGKNVLETIKWWRNEKKNLSKNIFGIDEFLGTSGVRLSRVWGGEAV